MAACLQCHATGGTLFTRIVPGIQVSYLLNLNLSEAAEMHPRPDGMRQMHAFTFQG